VTSDEARIALWRYVWADAGTRGGRASRRRERAGRSQRALSRRSRHQPRPGVASVSCVGDLLAAQIVDVRRSAIGDRSLGSRRSRSSVTLTAQSARAARSLEREAGATLRVRASRVFPSALWTGASPREHRDEFPSRARARTDRLDRKPCLCWPRRPERRRQSR